MADIHSIRASIQVLTNGDLLHCIINFVPLEWDLAQCAVACRAFYEPTIRVLWRTLGTLFPLWQLLAPQDVPFPYFSKDDSRLEYLEKVSTTCIPDRKNANLTHATFQVSAAKLCDNPARWDRFLWHTSHIRHLSYVADPLSREVDALQLRLLRSVVARNCGNSVFPLLRSFTWSEDVTTMLRDSSLSPLFTPTLRHASIFLGGSDHLANTASLRRLRESSPFLESITLDTDLDVSADLPLAQELASFGRLREVRLPSLTESQALQELLTHPNLTSLALFEVLGPWMGSASRTSISHLLELDICAGVPCLTSLFEHTRFEALRTVRLSCVRTDTHFRVTDTIPVLEALRSSVSSGVLQSITIFSGWFNLGEDKPSLRAVLAPILALRAIRSFNFLCPVDVVRHEDEDVDALARAWPALERLSLYSGIVIDSAVSVAAIHSLYVHCPALKEVSLPPPLSCYRRACDSCP